MTDDEKKLDDFLEKLESGDSGVEKAFAKKPKKATYDSRFTNVNRDWDQGSLYGDVGFDSYGDYTRRYGSIADEYPSLSSKNYGEGSPSKYGPGTYPNVYYCDEKGEPIAWVSFFIDRETALDWIFDFDPAQDHRYVIEAAPRRKDLPVFDLDTKQPEEEQ